MSFIYLDFNATTPIDPRVVEAMLPYLTQWYGNPSSGHAQGQATRTAIDAARRQAARLLGAEVPGIVWTSGGTESNNHALLGAARVAGPGSRIITSAVEHPAIAEVCRRLESEPDSIPTRGLEYQDRTAVSDSRIPG